MKYAEHVNAHLRITVLKLLEEQSDYTLNESLLVDLSGVYGFNPSRDRMRTELSWLAEQGLVRCTGDNCAVATLTDRGLDVAQGRVQVPGVRRPGPAGA